MTLSAGTRLGPYEILAPIGAGGMGEVYKARDTRLDRIVAIKVAAEQFSERFEREARAVAALNHPHICTLYDVGPNYLVMEYIEGSPLKGPLPLDEALRLAGQICDALDAAHRKGITHRDLKPGNILVTRAGVKLLDFGLAKFAPAAVDSDATLTMPLTSHGTILGTLQYMSPEQLEGKEADARSDIFAFGLVLYEMIAGKRAFEGSSQASLIAAILKVDPAPLSKLQPASPLALDRVVKTCLAKDPEERWQSAREVKHALTWWSEGTPPTAQPAGRPASRLWMGVSAMLALVALAALAAYFRKPIPPQPVVRLSVLPPDEDSPFVVDANVGGTAISPDGRLLAFVARGKDRRQIMLYVRPLDSHAARALPGTEGAGKPFWSPDSRSIGFFVRSTLQRIDVAGGAPQVICDGGSNRGATWNRDGVILFCMGGGRSTNSSLYRVPAAGGTPVAVTTLDAANQENAHYWPQFLPDGKHFLYMARSMNQGKSVIHAESLDDKPGRRRRTRLVESAFKAAYAPSPVGGSGYLLFVRGSTLMAQPFDTAALQLIGDPAPIAQDIGLIASNGYADFSVSGAGSMVYGSAGNSPSILAWRDRAGKLLNALGEPGVYLLPQLAPDGARVAVGRTDPKTGLEDIWLLDVERENSTRFTFTGNNTAPVWSQDGRRIAYSVTGKGIFVKAASGAGSPQHLTSATDSRPESWSPDGRFLLYSQRSEGNLSDLWMLPLNEEDSAAPAKPFPYVKTRFSEFGGQFSPDGRWVAYSSSESGSLQIYAQGFPELLGKWQVSTKGGMNPRWRGDGKELFYRSLDGEIVVVSVNASKESFAAGKPVELLQKLERGVGTGFSVTRDGQRFLFVEPVKEPTVQPLTVLLNWQEGLKK